MNPYEAFLQHQSLFLLAEQIEPLSADEEYAALMQLSPYQLSCLRTTLYYRALREVAYGASESVVLDFARHTQRKIKELLWAN